MMDALDLVVIDGPNLYNSVVRYLTRENDQATAKAYIRTCFDIDQFTAAIIRHRKEVVFFTPQRGIVIFHSSHRLGSEKTVKLIDREVIEFWARQGQTAFAQLS
jgi:hypothetical protein